MASYYWPSPLPPVYPLYAPCMPLVCPLYAPCMPLVCPLYAPCIEYACTWLAVGLGAAWRGFADARFRRGETPDVGSWPPISTTPRARFPIRLAGTIQFEQFGVLGCDILQSSSSRQVARLFSRLYRLAKSSRFRVSGGERPQQHRLAMLAQLARTLGQAHRFRAIAQRVAWVRGQNPRQVVEGLHHIGLKRQGLVVMIHRPPGIPYHRQSHRVEILQSGVVRLFQDGLLKLDGGLILLSERGPGERQRTVRLQQLRLE